jgi:hypothetical protein
MIFFFKHLNGFGNDSGFKSTSFSQTPPEFTRNTLDAHGQMASSRRVPNFFEHCFTSYAIISIMIRIVWTSGFLSRNPLRRVNPWCFPSLELAREEGILAETLSSSEPG